MHPKTFGLLLAAALVMAGCSGGATDGGVSASAPNRTPSVLVTQDVRYATDPGTAWYPRLLDIYAPVGATGVPLVVFFPGGLGTGTSTYADEATAIADLGAVVAVAVWGDPKMPTPPAGEFVAWLKQHLDSAACAVSFAVAHATDYGADPSRLVLVGHSSGASPAVMVALGSSAAFPGCAVTTTPAAWTAKGVLMWEGDWLNSGPGFDGFDARRESLATVMPVGMPWTITAKGSKVRVDFTTSDTSRAQDRRCEATGPTDWLSLRDPTGTLRARLTALGAFADGCIDLGETGELLADAMSANGFDVVQTRLTDPTTSHDILAPADLALLARHVLALADR